VRANIAALNADLEANGYSKTLSEQVRKDEAREIQLQEQVKVARQKAAHPLSESWGETQSLIEALDRAPDPQDVRLRLRSELRQIIDSVWLLAIPRGRDRLAAVQIIFAGAKRCRHYLIFSRPAVGGACGKRRAGWAARSFADAGLRPGANYDLRRREDARQLEADLLAVAIAASLDEQEPS
jgi:hypothetical protein